MAIRTRNELIESLKTILQGNTSDEAISILEDVSDTYDSLHNAEQEDWKAKYEENDKNWRDKYTARFYGGESKQSSIQPTDEILTTPTTPTGQTPAEPTEPSAEDITIDDLFS